MEMGHLITCLTISLSIEAICVVHFHSENTLVVMLKASLGALIRLKEALFDISYKHKHNCRRTSTLHTGRSSKSLNTYTHKQNKEKKSSHFPAAVIEREREQNISNSIILILSLGLGWGEGEVKIMFFHLNNFVNVQFTQVLKVAVAFQNVFKAY